MRSDDAVETFKRHKDNKMSAPHGSAHDGRDGDSTERPLIGRRDNFMHLVQIAYKG